MKKILFLLIALIVSFVEINAQCDYTDDISAYPVFEYTKNFTSPYYQTSPAGWMAEDYCSHQATPIADEEAGVLWLDGGKIANYHRGMLTSPVFAGGCREIGFSYKLDGAYANLRIAILQGGSQVWSNTIAIPYENPWVWHEYVAYVDITGDFQLVIENVSNSSSPVIGYLAVLIKEICLKVPVTSVATPTFSVSGREKSENLYWESATVTMETTTPDAVVYYTTDGTDPDTASTLYTDTLTLAATTTLKAVAVYAGSTDTLFSTVADTLITIAGPQTDTLPYSEQFTTGLGDWYTYNTTGEQEWVTGTENDTAYAQMSGTPDEYTVIANEDWLISPALTAAEGFGLALSFASLKQYDGPDIALKYSTDYYGVGDPSSATWTDVTEQVALPTSEAVWTPSGDIVVEETAPVRFAFVYTSTSSEAAIWQIADVHAENKDVTAPGIPTDLSGTPAETTIALSWTASIDNVGVTGYNVYVGDELVGTATEASYSLTGLTAATEYQISVEAVDAAGNKSEKASVTVTTTDETAPGVPTDLTGTPAETTIALSWTASIDNVGVTGYNVYVGDELVGTATETSYSLTGLTAATEYQISVETVDAAGNKSEKASISVTTSSHTGITSVKGDAVTVYPNPFDSFIIMEASTDGNAVIYDISGNAVLQVKVTSGTNQINTSGLSNGTFILKYGLHSISIVK